METFNFMFTSRSTLEPQPDVIIPASSVPTIGVVISENNVTTDLSTTFTTSPTSADLTSNIQTSCGSSSDSNNTDTVTNGTSQTTTPDSRRTVKPQNEGNLVNVTQKRCNSVYGCAPKYKNNIKNAENLFYYSASAIAVVCCLCGVVLFLGIFKHYKHFR